MKSKGKGFAAEFRQFALRGNVIDLAVGVIIGGAFASITNSLINDVAMPFLGLLGGVDFSSWHFSIGPIFTGAEPATINIGLFIQTVVNFLVLALVVFLFVKQINALKARAGKAAREKEESAPAAPPAPTETELLKEILDVLKGKTVS